MIPRTRFIITAVCLCHLFLCPLLLTSQLPAAQSQQNTESAPPPSAGTSSSSSAAPGNGDDSAAPRQSRAQPQITVTTDTGEEDTSTEGIIQQQLQESEQQDSGPQRPAINASLGRNEVLIRADEQEKNQDIYHVRGHVEIRFGGNTLHCDQATYDSTTGQITAIGHVVFDGGPHNEHVVGSRTDYNVSSDSGTFYDATGSTGARVKNRMMFLTSSTPFFFTGKVVDRLGPDHYRVYDGFVTSCQLPKPKWLLASDTANVEIGGEAQLHHAVLKLHGIPVFYFPYMEHPADEFGRKSGFLLPDVGLSNTRGTILGDAFYWAISRNADATIGAYLYSKRGWAEMANLRWRGRKSVFQAQYFGVIDEKGYPGTGQNQGGQELRATGSTQLPDDFVAAINVDYLSSYIFRLAFALAYTEAINSEVRSNGYVSKNWDGYGLGIIASRYQNYESFTSGDFISIVHSPSLELSTVERPFSRANFVYSYDIAAEGVSRSEVGFSTAPVVGRADAAPYLAWPRFFRGWTFRPQIGAEETYYSQRLEPSPNSNSFGIAVSDPMNRNVANASFEFRPPTLSKIFDRKYFQRVWKHTIEPYTVYRYQTGVNNFGQIIRFDSRDILADTNEVQYGVVNRLYSKKTTSSPQCYLEHKPPGTLPKLTTGKTADQKNKCDDKSGTAINVMNWELAQKYYMNTNFGGALVPGQRNVFDATVDFSGIAFLTEPRSLSPVISRLQVFSGGADFQWDVDYDTVLHQVNANTIFAGYRWGKWYLNGGQTYVNAPGEFTIVNGVQTQNIFNQWRVGLTYGGMTKPGFSGAASLGFDSVLDYLQAATIQTNYNWDCCGIAFQYQRWALGLLRNENAYRFAFSLTNVGTFGSIKKLQRLY